MRQRIGGTAALAVGVLIASAGTAEAARPRYGHYGGAGADEQGFFLFLEAGLSNVRNSGSVVAVSETVADFGGGINVLSPVVPDWADDPAGRLGFGYAWGDGNRVLGSVSSFETDQLAAGNGPSGGLLHFAIGPPIRTGGDFAGDNGSPGHYEIATELRARTVEASFAKGNELGEDLTVEWSIGLRYALFEEELAGFYDEASDLEGTFGQVRYAAAKTNEGEMVGAKAAVRGTYRLGERFSISSGLALSLLDGRLTGTSQLSPSGSLNSATEPSAFASLEDEGRSGSIRDFDVRAAVHLFDDRLRLSIGWEQSTWEDIATDLMRNFPGSSMPLDERQALTFSGYRLGAFYRF